MTDYVLVEDDLLGEALAATFEGVSYERPANVGTFERPTRIIKALIVELSEALQDDHSVGICTCYEAGLVEQLELRLVGKRTCPVCHGDSFTWREEHNEDCENLRAAGIDCNDAHYVWCEPTVKMEAVKHGVVQGAGA